MCFSFFAAAKNRTKRAPVVLDRADADIDMILVTVVHHGRDDLGRGEQRCESLHLQALDATDIVKLIHLVGSAPRQHCEHVLLQVRGHFFAGKQTQQNQINECIGLTLPFTGYGPVLAALQRQDIAKLPFLEKIVPDFGHGEEAAAPANALRAPAFLGERAHFDLRCICTDKAKATAHGWAARVRVDDYQQLCAVLHQHEEEIILDQTQARGKI